MSNFNSKVAELAAYLGLNPEDITVDGNPNSSYTEYITPNGDVYTVMTEAEADDACYDDIEELIDDLGIGAFSEDFQSQIYSEFLDDEWFSDACLESYQHYASDIQSESDDKYENRLTQECIEAGIISDSDINDRGEYTGDIDLVDALANYIWEDIGNEYRSYAEWYQYDFGVDGMKWALSNGATLDIQGLVDECIMMDGRGHFLSGWDGLEIDLPNYFAYAQHLNS